jgi:hypothetical protein
LVWKSSREFAFWIHLTGVIFLTLQSFPLLLAGYLQLEARATGIFATAAKLANFSLAVPFALSQAFTLWLGRRVKPSPASNDAAWERSRFGAFQLGLLAFAGIQAAVLYGAAGGLIRVLSRGRWTEEELLLGAEWVRGLTLWALPFVALAGCAPWFNARSGLMRSLVHVYLPWSFASLAVAAYAKQSPTPSVDWVMQASWVSAAALAALLAVEGLNLLRARSVRP